MKYTEVRCREGYAAILRALDEVRKRAKEEACWMYLSGAFRHAEVFSGVVEETVLLREKVAEALSVLEQD